jgi:16S rRNA (cytosine967-C5)-methyltransferase
MDPAWDRVTRLRENLLRDPGVFCLVADGLRPPLRSAAWDAVLADVPCSNTGVIRRRPDVRWRFSEDLLARLRPLQAGLLDAAAGLVRVGGRVVYSTCSIEPDENAGQVREFLARHPSFVLDEERELLPSDDHDGAYAARLVRAR